MAERRIVACTHDRLSNYFFFRPTPISRKIDSPFTVKASSEVHKIKKGEGEKNSNLMINYYHIEIRWLIPFCSASLDFSQWPFGVVLWSSSFCVCKEKCENNFSCQKESFEEWEETWNFGDTVKPSYSRHSKVRENCQNRFGFKSELWITTEIRFRQVQLISETQTVWFRKVFGLTVFTLTW